MQIGFLESVLQSGAMGRGIVALLLIVSVYSWAILIYKHGVIRRAETASRRFLAEFRARHQAMLARGPDTSRLPRSPLVRIFDAGLDELALLTRSAAGSSSANSPLSVAQIDTLERGVERAVSEQVIELRKYLIILATTAAAAPFVGLFGTVWGIMEAFTGMYATGSASISSVAPGVSAALTTTVAGLAVAIPALVAYNYLTNRIKTLTVQMDNFASEFVSVVQREIGLR